MRTIAMAGFIEYRVVVVDPGSRQVLALQNDQSRPLVHVHVPARERHVRYLQEHFKNSWRIPIALVDYLSIEDHSACVVAQVLGERSSNKFLAVHSGQISLDELSPTERDHLNLAFQKSHQSVSRIGWIDEAVDWVEANIGENLCPSCVEQYTAGSGFALLRFRARDDRSFWLKATGGPNTHERNVTSYLSGICPPSLPPFLAQREDWNAWLMRGNGDALTMMTKSAAVVDHLERAVRSLANLQMSSIGHDGRLVNLGVFDQRPETLLAKSDALFEYLSEVLPPSDCTDVPFIEPQRLSEIKRVFEWILCWWQEAGIPSTILHGDLNLGNLVFSDRSCQFIDWSEAYIGFPFVSFQHLLMLNPIVDPSLRSAAGGRLREIYRCAVRGMCDPQQTELAFVCAPLLAAISTLYGRGDLLRATDLGGPHRLCFARRMLQHIDRAAQSPALLRAMSTTERRS